MSSIDEQIAICLNVRVKHTASLLKLLTPLTFETYLTTTYEAGSLPAISEDLVKDANAARATCNDHMSRENIGSGELLRELVLSRSSLYNKIDSCFKVELALVEVLTGDVGATCMETAILRLLPSPDNIVSPAVVANKLSDLSKTELCKFSSRAAQVTACLPACLPVILLGF